MLPPRLPPMKRRRGAGRAGLLLALLSLLGQVAIAAPHATEQLAAVLGAAAQGRAAATASLDARPLGAAVPHEPSRCPLCQASALARASLNSTWVSDAPGPSTATRPLVVLELANVATAPVDPTASPRAPPGRSFPV